MSYVYEVELNVMLLFSSFTCQLKDNNVILDRPKQ